MDTLEETVLAGRSPRFGGGWVVDRDALLDVIDRMRSAVPAEVEDARQILQDRASVLARADEEAQVLLSKARQEAEHRVDAHDLVLEAQRRSTEIMNRATEQAREALEAVRREAAAIRGEATSQAVEQALEADRYSLDVIQRLDGQLNALLTSARADIDSLQEKIAREDEQRAADDRDAALQRERPDA